MKDYNNKDSKKGLNKKELEEISGGKGELKKGSAALVGSLMMLGGAPAISAGSTNMGAQKSSSFSKKWLIPAVAGGAITAVSAGTALYALNNYLKHKDPVYCLEMYFNSKNVDEKNSAKMLFKNSLWKGWKSSSKSFGAYIEKLMKKVQNCQVKNFLSSISKNINFDIKEENFFKTIDSNLESIENPKISDAAKYALKTFSDVVKNTDEKPPESKSCDKEKTENKTNSEKLLEFIENPKISDAAEKAFEISNNFVKNKENNHLNAVVELSSPQSEEIENIFEQACLDGDLPIGDYTLEDLNNVYKQYDKAKNGEAKFYFYSGLDALKIHNTENIFSDGDVVNLASQFNAMESPSNDYIAPVKIWPDDRTQGPRCALQSIEACKHREAAQLQGKLTDALKDVLDKCTSKTGRKMTEEYSSLYKNGYLQPDAITDNEDLEKFKNFICDENNINKMKFLSQWVKCEGSEKMQLQVFSAAPDFGLYKKWGNSDRDKLLKECSRKLIEVQYKALAQIASMRADISGKRVGLHVTMIGSGVFNNPSDNIGIALKALKENLEGHNVDVYLHSFKGNIWEKYAQQLQMYVEDKK